MFTSITESNGHVSLVGQSKEKFIYNQLSSVQLMAGFCRTMTDEPNLIIRNNVSSICDQYVILQSTYLMVLRTFHGKPERLEMAFFYVGWNRVKLVHGWKHKKDL